MSETTPTGIPIIDCRTCGQRHPETRTHCTRRGRAHLFLRDAFCPGSSP